MLLRHSFFYLIARGVPGIISLIALILYTRLLSAEEFGRYALSLSGVGLVQVLIFQWLHLVLARFTPGKELHEANRVLASIFAIFLSLSTLLILFGLGIAFFWPDATTGALILFIIPLAIATGWMEISLKLESINLRPATYGQMLTAKNLTALACGCALIWAGVAETAPLIGLLFGAAISWLLFGRHSWKGVRPLWPNKTILQEYASYGFPLAITFALGWVLSSSDRIIISYLIGDAATGAYAAGYDLTQQSLGLLLVIVNTAAYPLAMRALNQKGEAAATQQLAINGELIIAVALISAAVIIGLTPSIIGTVIGSELRPAAATVMPWIAAGAAIAGIKAFHFDVAFQLAKEPKWQAYTAGIAAVVNVVLNFLMIPTMGLTGAAAATLMSLFLACFLSWWIGRRVFPVPSMIGSFVRAGVVASSTYIGAHLVQLAGSNHFFTLFLGLFVCALTATISGLLVNICGVRDKLLEIALKPKG